MEIGKLPNSMLEKLILNSIETRRSETIVKPAVGEDCCVLELGNNLCVISTDPITAADENAGILAVLVSLNDLASCGAEPVGILTTVLLPPDTNEFQISKLFAAINKTCKKMNIDLLGGHTEITETVNKPIIITTAIGKVPAEGLVKSEDAGAGDAILMTKAAALEGTAIIASDKTPDMVNILNSRELSEAKAYINEICVLDESIAAATNGAHAMHDITEGGVLGAVWEICRASGNGAEIYLDKIPVRSITEKICEYYNISPYKLISSGSLLITCGAAEKKNIINRIKELGIDCTEIGVITDSKEIWIMNKGEKTSISQPDSDELYKVI